MAELGLIGLIRNQTKNDKFDSQGNRNRFLVLRCS